MVMSSYTPIALPIEKFTVRHFCTCLHWIYGPCFLYSVEDNFFWPLPKNSVFLAIPPKEELQRSCTPVIQGN